MARPKGTGGQAAVLSDKAFAKALRLATKDKHKAMLLLSHKAALRACEIAGLRWEHIESDYLNLAAEITKGAKPRRVPLHPELKEVLERLRVVSRGDHVIDSSHRGKGHKMTANAVAVWFGRYYKSVGIKASSHSGRRGAATKLARTLPGSGGSIKDAMDILGHANLSTTQRYLETNPNAQRDAISKL